jgi:cytochrome c553
MFKRTVVSFLLLVGLVGCGTIEYESEGTKTPIQDNQRDDDSGVNTSTIKTGKQLYASCAGCHGGQGEKEALGKSQLIGGQSYATTKYQLEEYRAGQLDQYGMGQLMKGQTQLTSEEIVLLAQYIETLSLNSSSRATTLTSTTPTVSQKSIYAVCKGCHGAKGEISALQKSHIIRDMNRLDIYNALVGYQNGTYGRDMKALMKGQVNGLSKSDLKDLARYFGTL